MDRERENLARVSPNLHASGDLGYVEKEIRGFEKRIPVRRPATEYGVERERDSGKATENLDGFLGVLCS